MASKQTRGEAKLEINRQPSFNEVINVKTTGRTYLQIESMTKKSLSGHVRNVGRMRKDEGALPERGAGTIIKNHYKINNYCLLFNINKAILLPKHLISQNSVTSTDFRLKSVTTVREF